MSAIKYSGFQVYPLRGMDQRWKVEPNTATRILSMWATENDSWRDRGGYRQITGASGEGTAWDNLGGAVTTLHNLVYANGALSYLVFETATGELAYFYGSLSPSGAWKHVRDVQGNKFDATAAPDRTRTFFGGPWARTQSAVYGDILYLVNGFDEPLAFDGNKASVAGHDRPAGQVYPLAPDNSRGFQPPSTAVAILGLGHQEVSCSYSWVCQYMNERGQLSPVSGPINFRFTNENDERMFVVLTLPIGPHGTVARVISRSANELDSAGFPITLGEGTRFYRLKVVRDNITEIYVDTIPDMRLGSLLLEENYGEWPWGADKFAIFKNVAFAAGAGTLVYFSAPGKPEEWPVDNVFSLDGAQGGPVTGLYAARNALVVFRQRGIHLIRGNADSGFTVDTLTLDVGCGSPNTVKELPGLGVVFLASDGVYLLQGALASAAETTGVVKLSTQISKELLRLNRSAMANACAEVYHDQNEYWLAIPTEGSVANNLVFFYSWQYGAWSTSPIDVWPISCMLETADERAYLLFGSHNQTTHAGIHVYSRGWANLDGTTISPQYETSDHALGSAYDTFMVGAVQVRCIGLGDNTLKVNLTVNRDMTEVLTTDKTHKQHYSADKDLPHFGTVTWSEASAVWVEERPVTIRYDVSAMAKTAAHEVRFRFEPTSRQVELMGYIVEAKGTPTKVRTLTDDYGGGFGR